MLSANLFYNSKYIMPINPNRPDTSQKATRSFVKSKLACDLLILAPAFFGLSLSACFSLIANNNLQNNDNIDVHSIEAAINPILVYGGLGLWLSCFGWLTRVILRLVPTRSVEILRPLPQCEPETLRGTTLTVAAIAA
jgi:hypothetical protein